MYLIKDGENRNYIEAYNEFDVLVGKALLAPFIASDIHEKKRYNIYIDIETFIDGKEAAKNIKDQLFDELIRRAYLIAENYKDYEVKFYHCCFADNQENIDYYSSKEGFKNDEGMSIIRKEITDKDDYIITPSKDISIFKHTFEDTKLIEDILEKQNTVFTSGYTLADIEGLKNN